MSRPSSRRVTAVTLAAALAVALMAPGPTTGVAAAGSEPPPIDAPRFPEVGRVPIAQDADYFPHTSGWLILDPASRRGYTLVEGGSRTIIQSFDLDTLQPRRRAVVPGIPIAGGGNAVASAGGAIWSGEVIHAVDTVARRIYLPISNFLPTNPIETSEDRKRMVSHFLVLDEAAFDRDPDRAFGAFTFPAGQERLQAYPLQGLAVSHHHVAPGQPGRLLAIFSSLNSVDNVTLAPASGLYDHTLAQWEPASVPTGNTPRAVSIVAGGTPVPGRWHQVLTACATQPLTTAPTSGYTAYGQKNFQWGILATGDAVLLGCQSAAGSGAVVRVAVDPRTGDVVPTEPQRLVALAKPIGDVLVDPPGGRLFVRSFTGGATWWTFDAAVMRFTGSIVGNPADSKPMAAGVDPGTGRLYALTADECVGPGGRPQPVRGGLRVTEARLDPVPAPENVVPELAYNSWWRIQVDPVRRRVFVRRGNNIETQQLRYPECDLTKREPAPHEFFYRVFEDRRPAVDRPPAGLDDSGLTTDTAEAAGLTEASFLGAGAGYGSRSLVIGGSLCGSADREAMAGSVGNVEVSDQSTVAEAAALDADERTQDVLGQPLTRCRPQAPSRSLGGGHNTDELNDCIGGVDLGEAALDQVEPGAPDGNGDGCPDRDGRNRYEARCVGTSNTTAPGFDDAPRHVAPRDGFEATADCDEREQKARASSAASVASDPVEEARRRGGDAAGSVRVARSSSTVSVARAVGKGITVKVDSIARGVEIPGVGTIGVVRAEATATATGRLLGASTRYIRTICDVDIDGLVVSGCLGDERQQQSMVETLNKALGSRGQARLRNPDPTLAEGTPHGYLAAVQRDRGELFADRTITRDRSPAVPALEIVLYRDNTEGAHREVLHLAGVQASTSYGIVCLYGKRADGKCAAEDEEPLPSTFDDVPPEPGEPLVTTIHETVPGETASLEAAGARAGREPVITRLLRALPRAVAEAVRLLFNNPRELGLLAALWALLYAPCYLGDRRRAVRSVAARRLTSARPA